MSERLPLSVAVAVLEFLQGDLLRSPWRVGHELHRELAGTWSARRGGYRVLYEIYDDAEPYEPVDPDVGSGVVGMVRVVDIDHGSDVYRRR